MNRRRFLATAAGATTVGIAGCFGDGSTNVAEEDIVVTVDVLADSFEPMTPSIQPGEAAEWSNERDVRAQIVSTGGVGDSWNFNQTVEPGNTTAYLFENAGVYAFHDRTFRRSQMCGAVVVGDLTEDDIPTLPCQGPR